MYGELFRISIGDLTIAYEWTRLSPYNTVLALILIALVYVAYRVHKKVK